MDRAFFRTVQCQPVPETLGTGFGPHEDARADTVQLYFLKATPPPNKQADKKNKPKSLQRVGSGEGQKFEIVQCRQTNSTRPVVKHKVQKQTQNPRNRHLKTMKNILKQAKKNGT